MSWTVADVGRLIDMDNHYYEPDDAFTRHLPSGYSGPRLQVLRDDAGQGRIYFGDQPSTYMQQTPTDSVAPPGMFAADREDRVAISAQLGSDDLVEPRKILRRHEPRRQTGMDGRPRHPGQPGGPALRDDGAALRSDPPACVANLRAFNRWLEQDWGFAYRDRIMGVAFLSLVDLDAAVDELDYVLGHGARVVHLLCTPVFDRALADPYFEPFWARTSEAGAVVAFHAANPGYTSLLSTHWGEDPYPTPEGFSAFQRFAFWVERAITDTVASLIFHNLFGRFPDQQVLRFDQPAGSGRPHSRLNLLLLLAVSFLPFPTRLVADALDKTTDWQRMAAVVYGLTLLLIRLLVAALGRVRGDVS